MRHIVKLNSLLETDFVNPFICYFGGGQTQSTTKSDPWSGQQGFLSGGSDATSTGMTLNGGVQSAGATPIFNAASALYNNPSTWAQYFGAPGTKYEGQSTVAPMNAQETSAISAIGDTGLNGSPAFNAAQDATARTLSGDPAQNQAIAAGVLPQLQSQFAQGNAMNSPAAAYASSQGLYSALLNNRNQAANTANTLYGSQLAGQNAALSAGQAGQTQSQNELKNLVDMWNYQQNLPQMALNQYANTVSGNYGGTTVSSSPNQSLFGQLFSDRRLKTNIKRVGTALNGLPLYSYTMIGATKPMIGVMADEVMLVKPEAVHKDEFSGYYFVDYDKALEAA